MKPDTLLFRVVKSHAWFSDGKLSDRVFLPREDEGNSISVYDSELVTAEAAYFSYAKDPSLPQPPGVVAITQGECAELGISVQPTGHTGHVTLTFPGTTQDSLTKTARGLSTKAVKHGWQYRRPPHSRRPQPTADQP